MSNFLSINNETVSLSLSAGVFWRGCCPNEVHAVSQPHIFPAHDYQMYLKPSKFPWHSEFNQRVDSPPGGLRERNRLSPHHSGQWGWWGKALSSATLLVWKYWCQIAGLVINVELIAHIAKAYMFFLNIFQIAVVVKTQGNVEQHQQDKEVLPVRDFGVDTRSLSALEPEFTVNIGPLCFLWHTQCVCVCLCVWECVCVMCHCLCYAVERFGFDFDL